MTTGSTCVPRWRDRLGRGLMFLLAAAALGAFVTGIERVRAAPPDTLWVETWQLAGFLVFAGMFALLGLRPRQSAGIWELAFAHKLFMALAALSMAGARDAAGAGAVDAVLAALIALAYACTRGWTSWRPGGCRRQRDGV